MTLKRDFGKKVKELRESIFLTQENFAEKLGINRNSLARIEGGTSFVSADTLKKIKSVLNVEYRELFTFDKKVKKNVNNAIIARIDALDEKDAKYIMTVIDAYLIAKKN